MVSLRVRRPLESRSLAWYLKRLNEIRGWHPALRWLRNLHFHTADDDNFLVFSKTRVVDGVRDTVLVVANLDPHATRETWVHLDIEAIGLATWSTFDAHDHVTEPDVDLARRQLRATRTRLRARPHHQRQEPLNPCRDSTSPSPG